MTLIRNEFIYELDDNFVNQLNISYWTNLYEKYKRKYTPTTYIDSEDSIECNIIKDMCPFMNSRISFFTSKNGDNWPVHVDFGRFSALNINLGTPSEASLATTSFYRIIDGNGWTCDRNNNIDHSKSTTEELFSFKMRRPTILNVNIPHNLRIEKSNIICYRRIVSWGMSCSFSDACKYF